LAIAEHFCFHSSVWSIRQRIQCCRSYRERVCGAGIVEEMDEVARSLSKADEGAGITSVSKMQVHICKLTALSTSRRSISIRTLSSRKMSGMLHCLDRQSRFARPFKNSHKSSGKLLAWMLCREDFGA
jgi:hypothetical protein